MHCHGIFGLLLPLLLFITPQPWRFLGEKVVLCACALCPPPPLCFLLFFFSLWGKQSCLQSLQTVSEVRKGLCVSLWKATRIPPACLPPQPGLLLQKGGTGSCHCSLGHCPGPVCLSVYLSALVCQLVRLSLCVNLLPQCFGPHGVCPASKWH